MASSDKKSVELWTDGSALGNPGPGGYGAILCYGPHTRELSAGYRRTTNNRMELLAVIRGLEALKEPCHVAVHSDSQYVVNGIEKGWARGWQRRGWLKADKKPAQNADLWARLLEVLAVHDVTLNWVRGHDGTELNERADVLAREAADTPDLPADEPYEQGATYRANDFWAP